jgi:serine protease Do
MSTTPVRRRRWSALLSACAVALLVDCPGLALADDGRPQANPTEKAAAMIRPAVVALEVHATGRVRLPDGELVGSGPDAPFEVSWHCTGFVVNPDGWVATAGHCADPDTARSLIISDAETAYQSRVPDSPDTQGPPPARQWQGDNARVEGSAPEQGPDMKYTVTYGSRPDITEAPASLVDFRSLEKGDVALLKLEKHRMPSSELAADSEVDVGTQVVAVGFPYGTDAVLDAPPEPTSKSGTVSRKATRKSVPEYEIDAAVSTGMSGGPVTNLDGEVIGSLSFTPTLEVQAFNFVAPADGLAVLMAGKGVKATLGPADSVYRRGLNEYYAGHYTDAITDFDKTLLMSPGYPGVANFRTDAANLRQQYGDVSASSGRPLMAYAVGALALLLGIGGAWLVTRRRRRHRMVSVGAVDLEIIEWEPSGVVSPLTEPFGPSTLPLLASPSTYEAPELLPVPGGQPYFCADCGAAHHSGERFCPNCGRRIAVR